jgi:7,8-dihydroneopterin aldolase/epimerase/oxygenase
MRVMSELAQDAYPLTNESEPSSLHDINKAPDQTDIVYRIAVRDLEVTWSIGVYDYEHQKRQPILINLDLEARALDDWDADDYQAVPCYARIVERIGQMAAEGHVKLVETLANRIAEMCLEDDRILSAKIRVEKPEALKNAGSVGVEITRTRIA